MGVNRILVADDFRSWRCTVCAILKTRPELQVIAEVENGLEAVQKAKELKPDLILLDIGLPTLNGLEAARRIRKLIPKSKIIFVSQGSCSDIVQGALALGEAYVAKSDVASALLTAVNAVLQGGGFDCAGFYRRDFRDTRDPLS